MDLSKVSDEDLIRAAGLSVKESADILARKHGIPKPLAHSLIGQESEWNQKAVSPKGAMGLTQLMPGTAKDLGVNPKDPIDNLSGGFRYLKAQKDKFGGWHDALWAYNAGPERVKQGFMPDETKNYLSRIAEKVSRFASPSEAQAAEIPSVGNLNLSEPQPSVQGNIDYNTRPIVRNADGTTSTVKSISFGTDQGEVLVPTISDDGREMSPEEAINQYRKTGKHLGIFKTPEEATRYAELHHAEMGPQDLSGMSDEDLAKIAGVDLSSMSDEDLFKAAGIEAPSSTNQGIDSSVKPDLNQRIKERYGANIPGAPTQEEVDSPDLQKRLSVMARPVLAGTGAVIGGIAGTGAAGPAGAPLGAGLGYSIGNRAADIVEGKPRTVGEASVQSVKDVAEGGMTEMTGMGAIKVIQKGAAGVSQVVRQILGRMSGTGTGAVEEALKGSPDFTKAMRGEISGDDVVKNAKNALSAIKDQRSAAYQVKLEEISKNNPPIDTRPAWGKLKDLMDRYNIKIKPDGSIDTSRIAMGSSGRRDIADTIETLRSWGTKPGDNTAIGLDTLKRQLDDFYSDSSQARQFVATARNMVKDLIVKNVPKYAEMTAEYADATKLIKDVEAGLMLRKQGMSGRIVADQTLRRLVSSMRDNFALRRDLVNVLGEKAKEDLSGQIAGHAMNAWIPRGLSGTGPAIIGEAALAKFVSPAFWPVLVASSPRVQGEFLRAYGKALAETSGLTVPVVKAIAYKSVIDEPQEFSQEGKP